MKKKLILHYPYLIILIINLFCASVLIYLFQNDSFGRPFFLTLILLSLTWAILIIDKMFHIRIPKLIYYLYYGILFLSVGCGDLFNFYALFPFFRAFIHFLLGVIFLVIGIFIIIRLDNIGYLKFTILITYAMFFVGLASNLYLLADYVYRFLFSGNLHAAQILKESLITLLGGVGFSVLLIIDYIAYSSKYLELLIKHLS